MLETSRFAQIRGDDTDTSILLVIRQTPGVIVHEIATAIGMSEYATRYRLLTLELMGAVQSTKERNRVRYYINEASD